MIPASPATFLLPRPSDHLHPAQDDEEHPPQPELEPPEEEPLDDFPIPKRERRFSVAVEPHCGHSTDGFDPNTSFSKQHVHFMH